MCAKCIPTQKRKQWPNQDEIFSRIQAKLSQSPQKILCLELIDFVSTRVIATLGSIQDKRPDIYKSRWDIFTYTSKIVTISSGDSLPSVDWLCINSSNRNTWIRSRQKISQQGDHVFLFVYEKASSRLDCLCIKKNKHSIFLPFSLNSRNTLPNHPRCS